jgi:GNAT superfamily N-acetyltransferase
MTYSISTAPEDVQLDIVYPWLRDCYWSRGVRREVVERAFANSMVVGAYRAGRQIGVARVVTDRATFAWLCDVFVDPAARGEGIATAMVRTMLQHPELATLRRWSLGTRDAHAVYSRLGFGPVDPTVMMQYSPDRSRWSCESSIDAGRS